MEYIYKLTSILLICFFVSVVQAKYRIAVIPKSTNHVYWDYVHLGAKEAAKEFGVSIIWAGPRDESKSQVGYLQRMLENEVDAVVIAPSSRTKLVPIINKLMLADIKIIIIDSGVDGKGYNSFIATDNYKAGYQAGEYLAKLMGEKGNAMLLRYRRGNDSTTLRENGFLKAIQNYPSIKLVYDDFVGTSVGSAYHTLLRAFTNLTKIDGAFAPNESSAAGLVRALNKNGRIGKMKVVGFDISNELVQAIKSGGLDGIMLQQPSKLGYQGVKQAIDALEGKEVKSKVLTEAILVTPKNINDQKIKSLLYISEKKKETESISKTFSEKFLVKLFIILQLLSK